MTRRFIAFDATMKCPVLALKPPLYY